MISLILFLLVNIAFPIILRYYYKNKYSIATQAFFCSLVFYFSIVILAIGTGIYLENKLQSFDLDDDGFFFH